MGDFQKGKVSESTGMEGVRKKLPFIGCINVGL
jgi:hypothetical protein